MLMFVDETSTNPLPASVQVSLYPGIGPRTPATLIAQAYTYAGGLCNISVTGGVGYVATFYGNQGPTQPQAFTGGFTDPTTVTVSAYRSPSLSQLGYTVEETLIWPRGPGWFGDVAKNPGGNSWAIAWMLASLLALFDLETQILIESERIQSAQGPEIAAWANDYLNGFLPQYQPDETDESHRARVIALLSERDQMTTVEGIQAILDQFFTAVQETENIPLVRVFDAMTDPVDFAPYTNQNNSFVVTLGYTTPGGAAALFTDRPTGYLDRKGAYLQEAVTIPLSNCLACDFSFLDRSDYALEPGVMGSTDIVADPRVEALVALAKAGGFHPIYQSGTVL